MSTIRSKYLDLFDANCQEAVFYYPGDELATVSDGKRTFVVFVAGVTQANVWPTAEALKEASVEPKYVEGGGEWATVGITTDEELEAADERIEWIHNSWYEVGAADTEDEDVFDGEVFHTVDEAIEAIRAELSKAPWVEVIVTRTTTYRVTGTNPDAA